MKDPGKEWYSGHMIKGFRIQQTGFTFKVPGPGFVDQIMGLHYDSLREQAKLDVWSSTNVSLNGYFPPENFLDLFLETKSVKTKVREFLNLPMRRNAKEEELFQPRFVIAKDVFKFIMPVGMSREFALLFVEVNDGGVMMQGFNNVMPIHGMEYNKSISFKTVVSWLQGIL